MKKWLTYILLASFIFFMLGCSNISNNKNKTSYNEKPVIVKNDINNKKISDTSKNIEANKQNNNITIVIDPGHSSISSNAKEPISPDSKELKLKDTLGATGINSNVPEYQITLGVSLELYKLLKSKGYNVILTKNKIETQLSNIERSQIANKNNANLIIRLHCDGVDSPKAQGASILIPEIRGYITKNIAQKSKIYGEKILNKYTQYIGFKNRGIVYRNDLTGFNWSKVPIVLLEMGFLSNPKEDSYLSNHNNYTKIANAIFEGINNCFDTNLK